MSWHMPGAKAKRNRQSLKVLEDLDRARQKLEQLQLLKNLEVERTKLSKLLEEKQRSMSSPASTVSPNQDSFPVLPRAEARRPTPWTHSPLRRLRPNMLPAVKPPRPRNKSHWASESGKPAYLSKKTLKWGEFSESEVEKTVRNPEPSPRLDQVGTKRPPHSDLESQPAKIPKPSGEPPQLAAKAVRDQPEPVLTNPEAGHARILFLQPWGLSTNGSCAR